MHEHPDAADLLETARALLLAELLPALPEAQKLNARMIANAMAIAARAARDDPAWSDSAEAAITALAGGDAARFATLIRDGAFDPGTTQHGEAARLLFAMARARCTVSAPRALD